MPRTAPALSLSAHPPPPPCRCPSPPYCLSVGDFLGRLLAGYGPWSRRPPSPLVVLAYSVLRCAVAAAILFCHLVTPTTWQLDEYLSQVGGGRGAGRGTRGAGAARGAGEGGLLLDLLPASA